MLKKILLVEDEALIAMNEAQMLKKHGYEVVTASSGKKAIEAVDADLSISLILMDIDLGKGMDGTVVAQRILETHDLPIAFLSSHTEPEVVEKTEGISSYGYIVKNSGETVLLASIKLAFRLYEAHMELKRQKEHLRTTLIKQEQTAEELYESEQNIRFLADNVQDVVWFRDLANEFPTYVSPSIEKVVGYTPQEILSMGAQKLHTKESYARQKAIFKDLIERGLTTSGPVEHEVIHKDGHTVPIEVNPTLIWDKTGTPTKILSVARDISTRKKVEKALQNSRNLLDATQKIAKIGGWEWNVARQTMTWADQTYLIHGFEPGEFAAGSPEHIQRSLACYDPDDRPKIEGAFQKCVEEGKAYTLELPLTTSQGPRIWVRTSAQAVWEDGKIVKVQGHIMDITERRQAEQKLREALEEKDFLMNELNHRVKNNLAMVSSLISLKDSEIENDLSDLKHRIAVIQLVHEKLHHHNEVKHIEVKDYFQELLESIFYSTSRLTVQIVNTVEDIRIPTKTVIPLGLVVNETATNAVKYGFTDTEEARFSVDMRKDSDSKHYLLTLSNTGNPFPQALGLENPETLGLQLVSSLVAQLSGTIELQKKPHPVFIIRFPIEAQ